MHLKDEAVQLQGQTSKAEKYDVHGWNKLTLLFINDS